MQIIGREKENSILKEHLDRTLNENGGTVLISGEPGMGKSTLLQLFNKSLPNDIHTLYGAALSESAQPFQLFTRALGESTGKPLFEEHEFRTFTELFAIDRAGILVAQAAPADQGLDADIFAGMFAAVQDFVRDSFDSSGEIKGTLGRLEYGDMKIIIEHGQHIFLVAVFTGTEHPDMKPSVRNTLENIEEKFGPLLEEWSGNIDDITGIQMEIEKLATAMFMVRKSLEGINLEQERLRISEEVLEIISGMSQEKTVLLIMEDLHWADESSLFVLNYLARNIRGKNILMVGTIRPREGKNVLEVLETVLKDRAVTLLELDSFDLGCIRNLVSGLYPNHRLPDSFLERLYEQSSGNPFFATELLRALEGSGNIIQKDGKYFLDEHDFSMPSSIEEVVYHRIESLESEAMALVEFASCIGKEFDVNILLDTIKGSENIISRLKDMGILSSVNNVEQFSHALFQSVVYDSLMPRWKTLYHKDIGEWYEQNYPNALNEVIYELARHFSLTREHGKIFDYCKLAGEKAESSFSPDLSITFYNSALDAIPKLKLGSGGKNQAFELLERVGEMYGLTGDMEKSLENYSKALEVAPDHGPRARIHRRKAYDMTMHGQFDNALSELEMAENVIEGKEHDELGFLLIARSFINLNKGRFEDTIKMAQEGIKILEGVEDEDAKKTVGRAWKIMGVCHLLMANYEESLRCHGMGQKIGEELNDLYGLSAAYNNIGNVYLSMGSLKDALEHYEKALEIMEKTKDLQGKSYTLNNIGIINKNFGNFEKAREYYEECLIIMEKTGDPCGMASSLNNIGNIFNEQGRVEEAMIPYEKGLEIARKIGDKQQMVNNLSAMAGPRANTGNTQMAEQEALEALEISQEIGSKKTEFASWRSLGTIHAMKNDWDKADESFNKAIEGFRELGSEIEIAKTMMERGISLAHLGNNDEAVKNISEAKTVFEKLEMNWLVDNCSKLLEKYP